MAEITLIQNLIKLDLTYGEARVYVTLLKLGSSKVGPIVRESRVSYSKIYDVLERLALKGLVSYKMFEKIKYFQCIEPFRLHDYIEKKEKQLYLQKQKLDEIIPELSKFSNIDKRSSSEIFIGQKAIRTAYEILLNKAKKGETLRYFYPYDDYHESASPFYTRLYKFQKSKKIDERGISVIKFKSSKHYKQIPKDVNLRFVDFPLPGTLDIFRDKVLVIDWKSITGILITSDEISDHFIRYFDSVWELTIK